MGVGDVSKRILVGRKLRSSQIGGSLLPKRVALPIFSSNPISSVAYAPDEIFLPLALAGAAAYVYSWRVGLAIALVMLVVVVSYRQNVRAYQGGGGDYEVASTNLGPRAGLTAASALLVDYVLTVAVSIAAATQYLATTSEWLQGHQVLVGVVAVLLLTAINLRGVWESARVLAIPAFVFLLGLVGMTVWGFARHFLGDGLPDAPSAALEVVPQEQFVEGFAGAALAFLLLRAFASGSVMLTGVEEIATGVPAFRKPKGRNAAITLMLAAAVAVTLVLSVVALANITKVKVVEDPATQLRGADGELMGADYHQDPVIGQLGRTIFDNLDPAFIFVMIATAMILLLAANTAFHGFPAFGSVLARDGYLPRQLQVRGDRLALSNGILLLAGLSIVLIVVFDANVHRLVQLYIVGVFVSFTVSQAGMVRHWARELRTTRDPAVRRRMQWSRFVNGLGMSVTGMVLVVVIVTKFTLGAWISVVAIALIFLLMRGIRRHYDQVGAELEAGEEDKLLPTRVHAIVLVGKLHKPTLRALAFAKATRPNVLEAVYVAADSDATDRMLEEWDQRNLGVPLKLLYSPYREIVRPVVAYVTEARKANPRGVVSVFIPEYVVGRWWEQLLHNQTALRLKGRLLFTPGVMVTSVPFQLRSSERAREREERDELRVRQGDLRAGHLDKR